MILYKLIDSAYSEYDVCKQRLQRYLQEIENVNEYNEFCELQGFVNNYLLCIPKIDKIINDMEFKRNNIEQTVYLVCFFIRSEKSYYYIE